MYNHFFNPSTPSNYRSTTLLVRSITSKRCYRNSEDLGLTAYHFPNAVIVYCLANHSTLSGVMEPQLCMSRVFWMVNLQVLRVGALVPLEDPLGSYALHAALLCG